MHGNAGFLSISETVRLLQQTYPKLSQSKLRYLEEEELIAPKRTQSGYRIYSAADIERLQQILYLQNVRYMPISKIKEALQDNKTSALITEAHGHIPVAHIKEMTVDRVGTELDVSVSFIEELAKTGLITLKRAPQGQLSVSTKDFPLIRMAKAVQEEGIGPRDLRVVVSAAQRGANIVEQVLAQSKASLEENERKSQVLPELLGALYTIIIKYQLEGTKEES